MATTAIPMIASVMATTAIPMIASVILVALVALVTLVALVALVALVVIVPAVAARAAGEVGVRQRHCGFREGITGKDEAIGGDTGGVGTGGGDGRPGEN